MNIEFYKKIIMSLDIYWVVARRTMVRQYTQLHRDKDQIILICIPNNIRRGLEYDAITLRDLETLQNCEIGKNIFLNTTYPSFQNGITMYDVYDGFPVNAGDKLFRFIAKALELESDDLYDYERLMKSLEKPQS